MGEKLEEGQIGGCGETMQETDVAIRVRDDEGPFRQ